jgi:hypothetical protein
LGTAKISSAKTAFASKAPSLETKATGKVKTGTGLSNACL